ncbi:MAG TPA: thioredoxin family protein [Thermoanaerobaculia bacterium]|nr:thioredoxin family protein [Thermoanaerobaculia bacterium]
MKRTILMLVMTAMVAPQLMAGGVWMASLPQARREAKKNDQLILVDMFAEWCGWCHRMEKEVFTSAKFQSTSRNLVLLRLDTEDGKEGSTMARELEVNQLPTFLLLTSDLTVAGVINGYSPPDEFVKRIEAARAEYASFLKRVSEADKLDDKGRLALTKELMTRRSLPTVELLTTRLVSKKGLPADLRDEAYYYLATSQALQKKFDVSIKTIAKFQATAQKGSYAEKIQMLLAQDYMEKSDFSSALRELKAFKTRYPASPLGPNADYFIPLVEQQLAKKQ